MKKIAVVYYSQTGNTEAMAQAIAKGSEGEVIKVSDFNAEKMDEYDKVLFGCPACGAEELDDSEFLPVFSTLSDKLKGKEIGLFGSYSWGGGAYMDTWKSECENLGAVMSQEPLLCVDTPDSDCLVACEQFGQNAK